MSELLNCPWCGGQPEIYNTTFGWYAECPAETTHMDIGPRRTRDDATEEWNNQTEVLRLKAEIARLREENSALLAQQQDIEDHICGTMPGEEKVPLPIRLRWMCASYQKDIDKLREELEGLKNESA